MYNVPRARNLFPSLPIFVSKLRTVDAYCKIQLPCSQLKSWLDFYWCLSWMNVVWSVISSLICKHVSLFYYFLWNVYLFVSFFLSPRVWGLLFMLSQSFLCLDTIHSYRHHMIDQNNDFIYAHNIVSSDDNKKPTSYLRRHTTPLASINNSRLAMKSSPPSSPEIRNDTHLTTDGTA